MGKRFATVLAGLCMAASVPATPALADSMATTGPATSVTQDSAILNGVIDPSSPNSAFEFEYGTTRAYNHATSATPTGDGLQAVSMTVSKLAPSTTYHFRIIVLSGLFTHYQETSAGQDMSFTTAPLAKPKKFGKVRLLSRKLKVRHATVSMRFKCVGKPGSLCDGLIALSTRRKAGKHRPAHPVKCARASFVGSGGHTHLVRAKLTRRCETALRQAARHRIGARLKAVFSTHQKPLRARVTLTGR